MDTMKIAISINTAWNIANFRVGLISALQQEGYEVLAIAPADEHVARLKDFGCRFVPLPMDNQGTNIAKDAALFIRYLSILHRERPAAFLGFTIKPNVYGSLAARWLDIPIINNVSGLGTTFIRDNWLTKIVHLLYRTAFTDSHCVFFQNADDCNLFVTSGLVDANRAQLVPGSGIDLSRFSPAVSGGSTGSGNCRFLLIARLLFDKGIREFVEAARNVRMARPGTKFDILGFLDVENRTAVRRSDVEQWVADGVINYLGHAIDVRPHIAAADCVVLPSYREGTPRSLLEAAAMGKPIIATDVPGCREVVDDEKTGLLCRARDAADLAAKLIKMNDMDCTHRRVMGAAGRAKMEREFDERLVIGAYLNALKESVRFSPGEARD